MDDTGLHPWLDHYPEGVDWYAPIPVAPLFTLMQDAGARYGESPAFDFLGRRTSWAQAASQSARIAAGLQRLGYKKGDRIGLLLPNCPAYPLMFFGALQAGLVVVNFNPLYTLRELEAQARDAGIVAIATLDLVAVYPKAAALLAAGAVRRVVVCPFDAMLPPTKRALFRIAKRADRAYPPHDAQHAWIADLLAPGTPQPVEIDPMRDVAVLQYTGGTSGIPKGRHAQPREPVCQHDPGRALVQGHADGAGADAGRAAVLPRVRDDVRAAVLGSCRGRDRDVATVRAGAGGADHRAPPPDLHAGRADDVQCDRRVRGPRGPDQHSGSASAAARLCRPR